MKLSVPIQALFPWSLFLVFFLAAGCASERQGGSVAATLGPGSPISPSPTPSTRPVATETTTPTAASAPTSPTPTKPVKPVVLATLTATPVPTVEALPTASPDPYAGLSIEALAARRYGGGQLDIVDTLERNDAFTRYFITYPSDGLDVYGYMNVPNEGSRFPVALVLHGYVQPDQYQTLAYTERYASALARAGYFVIHPSFRNHPPSDSGPNPFRIGYAVDVLNLIAIIREQSQDPLGYLRRADTENIYLWGHSMGGGVALRVATVNNAPYLRAVVLYGSMSGDERLNFERIRQWSGGSSGDFELSAPPEVLAAVSPNFHLERLEAPISIHHSDADDVVPPAWSKELCDRLQAMSHPVECHTYEALPHTFVGQGDLLFMERVEDFFNRN